MSRILAKIICANLFLISASSCAENDQEHNETYNKSAPSSILYQENAETTLTQQENVEKLIVEFDTIATLADKLYREGIVPGEDIDKLYNNMANKLDDTIELLNDPNNAYKFLNSKGMSKIVSRNLNISYNPLKIRLLMLIKTLFNVIPTTTVSVISTEILDKLLDIFEKDNLALKAHAVEILHIWLPENPKMQERVMKLKGLEPFYQQINKLDAHVIYILLDLFNKILSEHLEALKDNSQKSKADYDTLKTYQKIGLVERMSTPTVCNGLLNIFENTWSYNINNNNVIIPVFDLIKNAKPFCMKMYKGKSKAIELFDELLKFVKDPKKKEYFEYVNLNVTDVEVVIEDYVDNLRFSTVKDEF